MQKQAIAASSPLSRPAPAPPPQAAASKAVDTALPEGFFADKAADAKARGIKLPDTKDKEDEFQVRSNNHHTSHQTHAVAALVLVMKRFCRQLYASAI